MERLGTDEQTLQKYLQVGKMSGVITDEIVSRFKTKIESIQRKHPERADYEILSSLIFRKSFFKTQFYKFFKKDLIRQKKFNRNVDEIINSGFMTGCTDYAMVYSALARKLGIPATFLSTAERTSVEKSDGKQRFYGHAFCEVFDKKTNSWVLIDPTYNVVQKNYDPNSFSLHHSVYGSRDYIPFLRDLDPSLVFDGVDPSKRSQRYIQSNIELANKELADPGKATVYPLPKDKTETIKSKKVRRSNTNERTKRLGQDNQVGIVKQ